MAADSHEAAGDTDDGFILFQFCSVILDFLCMMIPVVFLTEGIDAGVDKFLHLFAADLHLVIQFFFFNNRRFFFFRIRHVIPPRIILHQAARCGI